jgi:hypothetical protein
MTTSTTHHNHRHTRLAAKAAAAITALTVGILAAATSAATATPTCAGLGELANHGQHVVGDYVTGSGGIDGTLSWPPNGQVGATVRGNGGAAVPGGPGPGFHFPNGFAPGASFCLTQSQSPGIHLDLGHDH